MNDADGGLNGWVGGWWVHPWSPPTYSSGYSLHPRYVPTYPRMSLERWIFREVGMQPMTGAEDKGTIP